MTRKFIWLVGMASILSFGVSGFAQSQTETPPAEQTGESTLGNDPFHPRTTVVVTATRTSEEVDKSPISTSIVTQKEIEARPMQSLDQQLGLIEGLYIYRNQGPSATDAQTTLRGFNGSARTLVLVDGHPVNDAYSSSVNWTGLPVGQVQSIEVARGPSSSLYGGNAMGGVINIVTRPVEQREFEVVGHYGTYHSSNYTARYSERFFQRIGISLGYERFQTGGYNSRTTTATPSAATTGILVTGAIPSITSQGAPTIIVGQGGTNWLNKHAYRAKGGYTVNSSTMLSIQYVRQDYDYGYTGYNSYLRDAAGAVVNNGALLFNNNGTLQRISITPMSFLQGTGGQHSHLYTATLQHAYSGERTLRFDGSYYDIPVSGFRNSGAGATETQGPGSGQFGIRRSYHGNAQYQFAVRRHNLTVGGETRHDMASNSTFALSNWVVKESQLNQTFRAFGKSINVSSYAQDQIALTERMNLVAGVRYDYWKGYDGRSDNFNLVSPLTVYPARSNSRVTGRVALAYSLPSDWNLRGSLGSAFRNPNVSDLYATSGATSTGTVLQSNPALKPESVNSWEVGVRKRFGTRTDFDAAYYTNYITDLIYRQTDFAADPSGRIRINVNAGKGRTRGLELSSRLQLVQGIQFRAGYTYTDAVITSNPAGPTTVGKKVTFIPTHMASGQLLGIRGKWTGSLTGRYSSAVFSTDTNLDTIKGVQGGYDKFLVMDSALSYNVNTHWQVYVSSENLLNHAYYLFYHSPGRTIYGGMKFKL